MGINATRGFTLLIAVIFASVVLAIALALASLAYKQSVLTSAAVQSGTAFYAADAALECTLYADQQLDTFDYTNGGAKTQTMACGDNSATPVTEVCYNDPSSCPNERVLSVEVDLDNGTRCADLSIYKYATGYGKLGANGNTISTFLFSTGYNISCSALQTLTSASRAVARGLEADY